MPISYSWSSDEERYEGQFVSREDAAIEAVTEAVLKPGDSVNVGENTPHRAEDLVRAYIDADHIIERLAEGAYENIGEHAGDWPDVSKEDCKKLNEALVQAIAPLVGEPGFWSIDNPQPVDITVAMFLKAHPPSGLPHCRECFEWIKELGQCCEEDGKPCEALTAQDLETP